MPVKTTKSTINPPRVSQSNSSQEIAFTAQQAVNTLTNEVNKIINSVNSLSRSGITETHLGKQGDIKVNKIGHNRYDLYIKGEDSWMKDLNASYGEITNKTPQTDTIQEMMGDGQIDHRYKGSSRILLDLDNSTITGVATPTINATGNLKFTSTGTTTVDSAGDIELNADGGDIAMKDNTAALASLNSNGLKVDNIKGCDSDVDKFLVSNSGVIEYRTGTQVLSDIGGSATAGTVTEVTVGAGLDVVNGTSTPAVALDLSELTDGTADVVGSADELIYLDASTQKRKQIDEIKLGQFNNDQGWTANTGDITGVDLTGGTNISIASETGTTSGDYSSTINQSHFMDTKVHSFYMTGTSGVFMPFGPSSVENSSTSDSFNDDTLFIAPYAGSLEFIKVQCATGAGTVAGATRVQLRVNGTEGAYVQVTLDNEVTGTFTFSSENTFSAGDRLRIKFDPLAAPKYVTSTSVWKYTL